MTAVEVQLAAVDISDEGVEQSGNAVADEAALKKAEANRKKREAKKAKKMAAKGTTAAGDETAEEASPTDGTPKGRWDRGLLPGATQRTSAAHDAFQMELEDELRLPTTERMLAAFGGRLRCFERFLLSRQYDVAQAAEAFRLTAAFRRSHGLDGEAAYDISEELRVRVSALWPATYCGTTADGSPVQVLRLGKLDPNAMLEVSDEEFAAYYIWWMEGSLRLQVEAYARSAPPASGLVDVYDCSGLGFAAFTRVQPMLARVLSIGKQYYPENLRTAVIVRAPLGFASAWSLVSNVLSERTVAKFDIRSDDGKQPLLELLGSEERLLALQAADRKSVV